MEPEPERRVVRAPGSRAPHQFSGRRLRQRGKNIERLEPRYAAGLVYCIPFAGRGTGRNAKYYLFSLNLSCLLTDVKNENYLFLCVFNDVLPLPKN